MKIIKLFLISNLFCLNLFSPKDDYVKGLQEKLSQERELGLGDIKSRLSSVSPKLPVSRRWRVIAGIGANDDNYLEELSTDVLG
jgi:hypothetical protein